MLEKAELTLIKMLSKTKKVITTPPPVLCSVASCKLFYTTTKRVETLSLLFVPPAEGGGMKIKMENPMTTCELFNKISDILKEKDILPDILDYALADDEPAPIKTCQFRLKSDLSYGSGEGIYLYLWIEFLTGGKYC